MNGKKAFTLSIAVHNEIVRLGVSSLIADLFPKISFTFFERPDPNMDLLIIEVVNGKTIVDDFAHLKDHLPTLGLICDGYPSNIGALRRAGLKGCFHISSPRNEIMKAVRAVLTGDHYFDDYRVEMDSIPNEIPILMGENLTEREIEFLNFACSDLNYNEIADLMRLSPKTIDGYRDRLFTKLGVNSRSGMVVFAYKFGIVKP